MRQYYTKHYHYASAPISFRTFFTGASRSPMGRAPVVKVFDALDVMVDRTNYVR